MSSEGLWHYPSTISDTTTTKEFLAFGPASTFTTNSTAGVINNFAGRQQASPLKPFPEIALTLIKMAFFISSGYVWSQTSNFLAHTWVTWATRGLYVGYRRTYLNTQGE